MDSVDLAWATEGGKEGRLAEVRGFTSRLLGHVPRPIKARTCDFNGPNRDGPLRPRDAQVIKSHFGAPSKRE